MRISALLLTLTLTGCGVADVGTAAVTTGKLQAEQAQQGKETLDKARAELDAAAKAQQQQADLLRQQQP